MALQDQPPLTAIYSLQLDEFLPPIHRWTRVGTLLLLGLFVGAMGAAAMVEYNVTVQAVATIRPVQDISLVQAATTGIVQQVLVKENQPVRQGDILAELGGLERSRLRNLQVRRDRLQAFLHQYEGQNTEAEVALKALESAILVKANFLFAAVDQTNSDSAKLPNTAPNTAIDGVLEQLKQTAPAEAQAFVNQRDRLLQQRTGLSNQIQLDRTSLQQLNAAIDQQVIQSPINGIILQLALRHSGQTVRQGENVAQIVPAKVPLVIKAQVAAQDISQVEIGQSAQIRVSAYPYPEYGTLPGTVQTIAPDVIVPPNGTNSMAPYYEVTLQPERPYFAKGDRRYPLQPGMEARADIISRQETILQAFLRKLRLWSDP
ncbi:HlyD family efflux transporter periplasmic adaptor subunit [Leptolyngbyaceae cyanobacterium UHCC 1019]